jgi:hypothetical protein
MCERCISLLKALVIRRWRALAYADTRRNLTGEERLTAIVRRGPGRERGVVMQRFQGVRGRRGAPRGRNQVTQHVKAPQAAAHPARSATCARRHPPASQELEWQRRAEHGPAESNKGGGHLRDQEFYVVKRGAGASQSARTIFHTGHGAGGDVDASQPSLLSHDLRLGATRRILPPVSPWSTLSARIGKGDSGASVDANVLSMQMGSSGK